MVIMKMMIVGKQKEVGKKKVGVEENVARREKRCRQRNRGYSRTVREEQREKKKYFMQTQLNTLVINFVVLKSSECYV